jgi:hypothetical protein
VSILNKMKQKQITLLTNAQIKNINAEYIKTIFFSRRDTLDFFGTPATMSLRYKTGKTHHLIFKLGSVSLNTVDDSLRCAC